MTKFENTASFMLVEIFIYLENVAENRDKAIVIRKAKV